MREGKEAIVLVVDTRSRRNYQKEIPSLGQVFLRLASVSLHRHHRQDAYTADLAFLDIVQGLSPLLLLVCNGTSGRSNTSRRPCRAEAPYGRSAGSIRGGKMYQCQIIAAKAGVYPHQVGVATVWQTLPLVSVGGNLRHAIRRDAHKGLPPYASCSVAATPMENSVFPDSASCYPD